MDSTAGTIEALVCRATAGDQSALNQLLKRYRPYLRIVAGKSIRDTFRAKFDPSDAVQQACLDAFHGFESFEGKDGVAFNAWLTTILQRNIANLVREHTAQKRDVRREYPLPMPHYDELSLQWQLPAANGSAPDSRIIRGEAALILADALSRLSERQQMAMELRFIEGQKLAEIAEFMEIKIASVATLIDRGLESMRQILPDEFV